jgi:molecular chaperone HtpG
MERLMERMGRGESAAKRVLELNPKNPAVVALGELYDRNTDDPRAEGYARLLYDQAVIAEGSPVDDPAGFAKRVNNLIARDASAKI